MLKLMFVSNRARKIRSCALLDGHFLAGLNCLFEFEASELAFKRVSCFGSPVSTGLDETCRRRRCQAIRIRCRWHLVALPGGISVCRRTLSLFCDGVAEMYISSS